MVSMDENIVTPQLVSNIVYGNCLADFEEAKVRVVCILSPSSIMAPCFFNT